MLNFFHDFVNQLDSQNPEDARIIAQRKTYSDWREKIAAFAPDSSDIQDWEINPVSIYAFYRVSRQDLATFPAPSALVRGIQQHLIEAYHQRGLYFPTEQIYAIADPDETEYLIQRTTYQGILTFMGLGFDLRVPIVMSKDRDGEQFDFFFALKLLNVPVMNIDQFLQYHLEKSFKGDNAGYNRFLNLLLRYISTEMNNLESEVFRLELLESVQWGVEEWQGISKPEPPLQEENMDSSNEMSKNRIHGKLNDREFRRALNGMRFIIGINGKRVISPEDLEDLKNKGPFIDLLNTKEKITLNIKRGDREKVYGFFHWLWEKHSEKKNTGRMEFAEYLQTYFQDFSSLKLSSIANVLRCASMSERKAYEESYVNSRD